MPKPHSFWPVDGERQYLKPLRRVGIACRGHYAGRWTRDVLHGQCQRDLQCLEAELRVGLGGRGAGGYYMDPGRVRGPVEQPLCRAPCRCCHRGCGPSGPAHGGPGGEVFVYTMRYNASAEDRVHELLPARSIPSSVSSPMCSKMSGSMWPIESFLRTGARSRLPRLIRFHYLSTGP